MGCSILHFFRGWARMGQRAWIPWLALKLITKLNAHPLLIMLHPPKMQANVFSNYLTSYKLELSLYQGCLSLMIKIKVLLQRNAAQIMTVGVSSWGPHYCRVVLLLLAWTQIAYGVHVGCQNPIGWGFWGPLKYFGWHLNQFSFQMKIEIQLSTISLDLF